MGTLIDRFEEHDGPVRSVDFHPTQPIFVSGGDDYSIRVWSTQSRKCMFVLQGHLDYVRTVMFHKELPWIISASDDQTIRIWNWQNRQEIACLTGHNHYVMCARFHPTDDLVVSTSLDQTVRVWDISGLRKKHSAPGGNSMRSFEDQLLTRQQVPQQDIFGNTDAVVKYVLEGHDKGVNWADFHPTLPLIVSGGDDRLVKIWRMSETRAWEVDTCRGHTNNVLSVLFHPHEELILSVGEDRTIRTWDLNKRTPVKQFRRDHDRFWLITAHPHINLFAACHDSGVMVFKLDRERPAYAISQDKIFFVNNEKQLQLYDMAANRLSPPMLSLKKIGKNWSKLRTLSYNPAERSILVTTADGDSSQYAVVPLPKDVTGAIEPSSLHQGDGLSGCFVARNRFVVFVKFSNSLEIKDLNNTTTKTIPLEGHVKDVVAAPVPGTVLLLKPSGVVHYDVQQRKVISELSVSNVKYVSWSSDGSHVALISKHTITIASKTLEWVTSMHETIRIKSAAWDDATGVLVYSTLNHIKYILLNGDSGIIKTLENTLYVLKVHGKSCYCLSRSGTVKLITIDPTEFRFKRALINKNYSEVLRIIKNSTLVGQNIIGYLDKRGYPEVALQFVQDPETRFQLALECSDLVTAFEEAKKIKTAPCWEKLGTEALAQGNSEIVELAFQQLHQFEKLSFFYLLTGDVSKLRKMEAISEKRGSVSSLLQNTIYLYSVEKRAQVLLACGMAPLAYTIARSNNLDDLAESILESEGVALDQITLPDLGSPSEAPQPMAVTGKWPLKPSALSFLDKATMGQLEDLSVEEKPETQPEAFANEDVFEEAPVDDQGWDLGDEDLDIEPVAEEEPETDNDDVSSAELKSWKKNTHCAAGYVAAGSFEAASQMLNKQVGIVNFEPLKSRFMQIYLSSKTYLPANENVDPLATFIRFSQDKVLPFIPGMETLETRLHDGFNLFRSNKLEDAIHVFRGLIHTVALMAVDNEDDEAKCKEMLTTCRDYILGLSIELKRRQLPAEEIPRNLELAAYFTKVRLQPAHRVNALQVAMTQFFKNKNYATASFFADDFLKIVSSGTRAEQATKIKAKSDSIGTDAIDIEFDPYNDFDICAKSLTPIYQNAPFVAEPLTGARYQPSEKGKLCDITQITAIGAPGSGLRIMI